MHNKETLGGQHIAFFYTVDIVSSSATATHNRHHLTNINLTILLVLTMG